MMEEDVVKLLPAQQVALPTDPHLREQLCSHLASFVTPRRLQRLEFALKHRTRWLTVALEDVFQPHNASAILRSCDCFGVQDVHIVDQRNEYKVSRAIALGAAQWLDLYRHGGADSADAVSRCCVSLKQRGYRLVATTPHEGATDLNAVDLSGGPIALLFGTELTGLSDVAMDHVDEAIRIPLYGLAESLNVSVSAALILRQLTEALRSSQEVDETLDPSQQLELRLAWLRRSMRHGEAIIRRFLDDHGIEGEMADQRGPCQQITPGVSHDEVADFADSSDTKGDGS